MPLRSVCSVLVLSFFPVSASADLQASFRDGAPKDRFTLSNTGACATGPMTLSIDMSNSVGKLIFDVTGRGAGVEVFQPLEITSGAEYLRTLPEVRDGQTDLSLDLTSLPAGASVTFTIDVDDTIGRREITVDGSEIQGSELIVLAGFASAPGVFDTTAIATVQTPDCLS